MFLGDILKIKAGSLIKGIRLVIPPLTGPADQGVFIDMDKWTVNGLTHAEYDKNKSDPTTRLVPLTLIKDHAIKVVAKDLIDTVCDSDLTTTALLVNSRVMHDAFTVHSNFHTIRAGDIVGMSLGKTIVSFQPEAPEIYRKGTATLCCFHCVLMKQKIYWIRMMSKTRVSFYDEEGTQRRVPKMLMEII